MSRPSPARYRTTNWSGYTTSLRERGSLLIWLDKEMALFAPPDGEPGRPAMVLDAAIGLSDDQSPVQAAAQADYRHDVDLSRFRSGLLRAILAIKETGYGSDTQRRVQA